MLCEPIAVGRGHAIAHGLVDQGGDLSPNRGMIAIRWMDSKTQKRVVREAPEKGAVPGETHGATPAAAGAVDERLGGDGATASEIPHRAQGGCVAQPSGDHGSFGFGSEEPSRGDESVRMISVGFEILFRVADQAERVVVREIVEFAFACCIKAGDELGVDSFVRAPGALMEETMEHDLVSPRLSFIKPRAEVRISEGATGAMVIGHDEKRTGDHAMWRKLREDALGLLARSGRDIMNGDDQCALHAGSVAGTQKRTS